MALRNFEILTQTNNSKVHHLIEDLEDSMGHSISLSQDGQEVVIDCIDKAAAEKLFDLLADKDSYFID